MEQLTRRQLLAAAVGSPIPIGLLLAGRAEAARPGLPPDRPGTPSWLTYNLDKAPGNLLSRELQETQCGWMQGWQAGGSLRAYPQIARVQSNNDGFMLKAVSSGWGSCGPSAYIAGYQVKVDAPVPASLTFSAYLSAAAPTTALNLQLTFYTRDANHVGTETSAPLALTTTPQQLSFTASVPANAHYVQPEFLLENAAGNEIIYVDFVVLRASPSLPAPSIVTHNRTGPWTTNFFDDFNTFDTNRWDKAPENWEDPPGLGSHDPGLVTVANSILTLKSEQRGGAWRQALVHGKTKGVRINTGLIEWRAKMPSYVKGVHPALWLMPCDSAYGWWPHSGEIDVIEYVGTEITPTVDGRQTFYSTLNFSDNGDLKKVGYPCNMQIDWGADWHVYQCLWERATDGRYMFRFAVDDVPYGIIDQSQWVAPPGSPLGAPFEKHFYLIMNMSCGGAWAGMPEAQAGRTALEIDWVKVSQRS